MINDDTLKRGMSVTLDRSELPELGKLFRGKVRDSYIKDKRRAIVVSDRISAFDVVLGTIPFKGQILNGMAAFWFEQTRQIAPNHLIAVPDPAVSVVHECSPFAVEMVVRGYLTGSSPTSLWTHYDRGAREYCGHRFSDNMRKHQKLDRPIVTPTTKAEAGEHDEPISAAQVVERGLSTAEEFERLSAMCLELFDLGTRLAAERDLILVDTKYELGIAPDGQIVFIDEIHTPDSSRYWYADSYEKAMSTASDPRALDKDFVRRTLIERGYSGQGPAPELDEELVLATARRYVEIYEQVTGQDFVPNLDPPEERIRKNLASFAGP